MNSVLAFTGMRLDDCYRLLDLDRRATTEEIKRAHRDLTKVWHPDRFGHDAALRRKAEEKLKAINEAYETILASHPGSHSVHDDVNDDEDDAQAHATLTRRRIARNRNYALACALLAIFILLRRPTPAGLVIALVLLVVAGVFVARLRIGRVM